MWSFDLYFSWVEWFWNETLRCIYFSLKWQQVPSKNSCFKILSTRNPKPQMSLQAETPKKSEHVREVCKLCSSFRFKFELSPTQFFFSQNEVTEKVLHSQQLAFPCVLASCRIRKKTRKKPCLLACYCPAKLIVSHSGRLSLSFCCWNTHKHSFIPKRPNERNGKNSPRKSGKYCWINQTGWPV